jgi:hypothetical protein
LASNALFSPVSNSQFHSTTTQFGLNSTEIECATSQVF